MEYESALILTFVLLVLFQLKHFAADFPFQSQYMLKKVRPGWDFAPPLALHCAFHAGLTLAVVLTLSASLWWLALLDFVVHFLMDRIKAGPHYLGRYNDLSKKAFWNCLGFDQMVHHLTHFYIVWMLVTTRYPLA